MVRLADRVSPIDKLALGELAIAEAREAMKAKRAVVIASGSPGLGRRSLLVAAAAEAGIELLEIDAKRLAKDHATLTKQLRMIARECKLLAKLPLIRNIDALVDEKDQARVELVGTELAAELDTTVFVTSGIQRPQLRWELPVISIEVKPPSSLQRATLWRELLADASEGDADYLATQYPLAPALMHAAASAALARAATKKVTPKDIEAGIRAVLDDKLGHFAKRVEVTQTWEDLVIEEEQGQSITELIARIRQRRTVYEQWGFAAKVGKGLGVSALFSGPPGTGKTMVAALIAKELGLELYQVDMGKLVSKYIGETEKQLGELFDAAEAGHAILLFDEADSLFGKRTDVRSSNDRYANLETNYLLQRLESFTGICLLTSNHESNIDPAFQRRLSLHLRFHVPDEQERARLWRAMLPAAAPVAPNIDFAGLARRYEMTGGYIRNAALRAAFLAADAGTPISDAELEHAAELEYEGMGKIASPNPAKASSWPSRLSSSL
ncbi:MAG: AAA family ATPase [Kofleriaceae bacterium]